MTKIYDNGHFLAFAPRMIRFCLVIVVVGSMCHKTAAQTATMNITGFLQVPDRATWIDSFVYFVDGLTLFKYDPDSKTVYSVTLQAHHVLSCLVPVNSEKTTANITLAIGYGNRVGLYTWDGKTSTVIKNPDNHLSISKDPEEVLQCGRSDVFGRLWVGTAATLNNTAGDSDMVGRIYLVDKDGTVTNKLDNIGVPGDISWSPRNDRIYYVDLTGFKIIGHSVDKDFVLSKDEILVFDFLANKVEGDPNYMAVDYNGNLWVTCKRKNRILQIDPNIGKILKTVDIPGEKSVVSVTFGGAALDVLYVTTEYGSLYRLTDIGGAVGNYVISIDPKWPKAP